MGRPWQAELSGRLLSTAVDIAERAHTAAAALGNPAAIRFRHVIYVSVAVVRRDSNLNVYAEPNCGDHAHANFVAMTVPMAPQMTTPPQPPKVAHEFAKRVAALFDVCNADDLAPLENLRVSQI